MALRVSTTGSDVFISDLGIWIIHPTVKHDLSLEFTALELKESSDLTSAIQAGDLNADDGTNFIHRDDYDPDELLIQLLGYNRDSLHISHDELASAGDIHLVREVFPLSLNSTASSTRNIYAPTARFVTWQLEKGDLVTVAGSSAADGNYIVESVTDQQNFIVVEAIENSTGGTIEVFHLVGASRVGVDPSNLYCSDGTDLQTVLEDLDSTLTTSGGSGLSPNQHRELDQLVHNIAEDSYEEATYSGIWPTTVTVWTDETKTTKIREESYVWNIPKVSVLTTVQYNISGVEVERAQETYIYSGIRLISIDRKLV